MDQDTIIKVDHVSMKFNLSSEKVDNFKEYLIKRIKNNLKYDEFWALTDVDFEVKRGESVALIGLNGCGKSTMLKVIVSVGGTIAPMIELGAGFDMDLTARENVYLNGAILGYNRAQMNEYYDDLVEFSELEEFMDVPIKNFSSGMLARLAFSIATIGKPDILIVDEVLSVGDFRFQEKCEKRIQGMMKEDTTILFVSHSIDQVKKICKRAIWIEKGHIRDDGPSDIVGTEFERAYYAEELSE